MLGLLERGQVDGRREDVVRGLAEVDVIVGVDATAGERCDHLVGVRVRRGPGAGLEDVDRELVVVLCLGYLARSSRYSRCEGGVEQAQLAVDLSRGRLDSPEPVDNAARDWLAGDLEVLDCLAGLVAVEGLCAHERRPFRGG